MNEKNYKKWHYTSNEKKLTGPFNLDELILAYKRNEINNDTEIFHGKNLEWKKLSDWPELSSVFNNDTKQSSNKLCIDCGNIVGNEPSSALVKCDGCGQQISKNAKECPKCGWKPIAKCKICDQQIPRDSSSCPECGEPAPFEKKGVKEGENKQTVDRYISVRKKKAYRPAWFILLLMTLAIIGSLSVIATIKSKINPHPIVFGVLCATALQFLAFTWKGLSSPKDTHENCCPNSNIPYGVGGWLGLLVAGMLIIGPLLAIGNTIKLLIDIETQFTSTMLVQKWILFKNIYLTSTFVYISLSFYGGYGLAFTRKKSSIYNAILILWLTGPVSIITDILVFIVTISIESSNIIAGIYVIPFLISTIYVIIWSIYLHKSKRVMITYTQ